MGQTAPPVAAACPLRPAPAVLSPAKRRGYTLQSHPLSHDWERAGVGVERFYYRTEVFYL